MERASKRQKEFSDKSGFQKKILEKPFCCAFSEMGGISEASERKREAERCYHTKNILDVCMTWRAFPCRAAAIVTYL